MLNGYCRAFGRILHVDDYSRRNRLNASEERKLIRQNLDAQVPPLFTLSWLR